jgi:spore coat protein CotH
MRFLGNLALVLLSAVTLTVPTARAADEAAWMFDPLVMVDVNLTIPQTSMDQIPSNMDAERPYVPATFTMTYSVDGNVVKSYGPWGITLKVKGMYGSFRSLPNGEKAGLKLKFPSGRRPDGLKKFTLNNMVQDGTMVHEALSYEVFRAMGVAAPRTGYARVTINGVYFGIYLNLETPDTVSLPRWFPTTGHLYEGSYGGWWGDVGDAFSGHYEVDEGSEADRTDLQTLLDTARNTTPGWYARMEPIANLEQMTRMWACEWFTGHWDGYSQFITNNYYLHSDASGRFSMMPWGTDQTFTWANRFDESGDHFIFNNCMRDPIGRAMYTDALQEIAAIWEDLELESRADEIYQLVSSESGGVHDVKNFISARLNEHNAWIAKFPKPPASLTIRKSKPRVEGQTIKVYWEMGKGNGKSKSAKSERCAVEYRSTTTPWTRINVKNDEEYVTLKNLPAGSYTVRIRAIGKQGDSLPLTQTFVVEEIK